VIVRVFFMALLAATVCASSARSAATMETLSVDAREAPLQVWHASLTVPLASRPGHRQPFLGRPSGRDDQT
jgi:hypothetical protein